VVEEIRNMHLLLASETVGDFYQFARLQAMSEWWHWLMLAVVCAVALVYVVTMYRRDSVELSRSLTWLLVGLRLMAFAGVLFYFFDLEKRAERRLVKNSRVLLLVDTSQSMGLADSETSDSPSSTTRMQRVINQLSGGRMIDDLRARHDVVVYRFDQESRPVEVAALPKTASDDQDGSELSTEVAYAQSVASARVTALGAGGLLFLGVFLLLVHLIVVRPRARPDGEAWSLLGGVVVLAIGLVVLAVSSLRHPDVPVLAIVGLQEGTRVAAAVGELQVEPEVGPSDEPIDWNDALAARGLETRIGDALRYLVNQERGGPVAGIVLFSDGQQNAGTEHGPATSLARMAEIPIYTVGLGSDRRPLNVRVVDLEAPERVYPGDRFTLTGYLQATNYNGRHVDVRLTSYPAGAAEEAKVETVEAEQQVALGDDGEIVTVRFEVHPDQSGRRTYQLFAKPPPRDHNPADNVKTANVEVVDRRSRVLLLAGGPLREYRFLRTYLYRDRDTVLDVLLQSGVPGMAQEADNLLMEFPSDLETLFEYDCIVAFDPDWTELDILQMQALEQWVAEQAGGLIVIAGPVHTPQWADVRRGDPRFDLIRALYPVVLYSSGSPTLGLGRFGGETAWPLQFTREGLEADFLWLEDDPLQSEAAWSSFGGVYGYYAVKDHKPGARVYSRFSDPTTAIDGVQPIYLAGHFYGAGRVFFQASGEMWRIRAMDETYFERYYTKLIRWVSQGRLLRDSQRGVLLVDKDRCLRGDTVVVQALLTDAQNRPLNAPEVIASLVHPNGTRSQLLLRSVAGGVREGAFTGQFTAVAEGDFRVELRPPQAELDELLVREVRSRIPALEIERPERNDAVLSDIALSTGGVYYVGIEAAAGTPAGQPPLAAVLQAQDFVSYLPGTPDRRFDRLLMGWLMGLICGALALEWLFRRLSRLA
jgi:hypothetical protein